MTLSPWRTLQIVIQTQKSEPCQLTYQPHPFLQEAFHLTQPHPQAGKRKPWPQFNRHALDNNGWVQRRIQDTQWPIIIIIIIIIIIVNPVAMR